MPENKEALNYFCDLMDEGKMVYRDGRIVRMWESRRGWLEKPRYAEKLTPNGYYLLRATFGGKRNKSHHALYVMAHRVIWTHLKGEIPPGMQVNHKNGIKTDNRIDNLELVTAKQNALHAKQNGITKPAKGVRSGRGKLSDKDVLKIRELLGQGTMLQREIAEIFGVRPNQVSRIKTGQRRQGVMRTITGLNEFQELSKRTLNTDLDKRQQILNYALGLAGEAAGEVGEMVKKAMFHGHELNRDKIAEELGDVMFYVAALATTLNVTLEDIATFNISKLAVRYPSGFSAAASVNRREYRND